MTEDETVGWHRRLDGHEFEQALGVSVGQGGLACCRPWGCKESDTTELNDCPWSGLPFPSPGHLPHPEIEYMSPEFQADSLPSVFSEGFSGGTSGKETTCQCRGPKRCRFDPWVGKNPWRWAWQSTPILLPGESHGQRSLASYYPQGLRQSDMTEAA